MTSPLPPLTWFRAFEAAARHLNFTAAAAEIGMTQSAVSQQVKALETRLRTPLFVRRARGLALTDAGRRLLPQVESALGTLAEATLSLDPAPTQDVLTVAASVSVLQWVIAPQLASFRAAHPDVSLRFQSAIWPDDFQSSRADVDIRFGTAKQSGDAAELLTPAALIPLSAPQVQGNLSDLPLIEAVGTSTGWQAWSDAYGGTLRPRVFVDTYGMALHLAAQGNGVALVSALLAGHALASGQLVRAHSGHVPAQEGYYLTVNSPTPHATAFATWLKAQLPPV